MPKYVMEEFSAQEKGDILVISFFKESDRAHARLFKMVDAH